MKIKIKETLGKMRKIKISATALAILVFLSSFLSVSASAETISPSVEVSAVSHGKGDNISSGIGYIFSDVDITSRYANYYYSDEYFAAKSTVYNSHLATMSLVAAFSSFSSSSYADNCYLMAEYLFTKIGFSGFETNAETDFPPSSETIGVIMAKKTLLENGEPYTLVSIVIRGGGYESEWASNFLVGSADECDGNHKGFSDSRDRALTFITDYLERNVEGNTKLWITGFSRGGAVAGMLGAWFNDNKASLSDIEISLQHDDIFAYTFEAPASMDKKNLVGKNYNNIFNSISENDYVTRLPFSGYPEYGWNFERPGVEKTYTEVNKMNIDEFEEVLKAINSNSSYEIGDFTTILTSLGSTQSSFLDKFVSAAAKRIDRQTYAEKIQGTVFEIMNNLMSKTGDEYNETVATFVRGFLDDIAPGSEITLSWVFNLLESLLSENERTEDIVSAIGRNLEKAGIIDEYDEEIRAGLNALVACSFQGGSDDIRLVYFFVNMFLNTVEREVDGQSITENRLLEGHQPYLIMALQMFSDSNYSGNKPSGYKTSADNEGENVVKVELLADGVSYTAYYYRSDTVKVNAEVSGCISGTGWYCGSERLSDSYTYVFSASESLSLEFKTEEYHAHTTDLTEGHELAEARSGVKYKMCNDCGKIIEVVDPPKSSNNGKGSGYGDFPVAIVAASVASGILLLSAGITVALRRRAPKK